MYNKVLRKWVTLLAILLFFGISIIPAANSYELMDSKISNVKYINTLYVGGSGPNNYTNIQDAIDDAENGDTVFVYDDSSPYFDDITVDKSISLIGEDKNTTIINGNNNDNIIRISANDVIIENFTITNGEFGVVISAANNCTISNNIFNDNIWYAIGVYGGSHYNLIINNYMVGSDSDYWMGVDIRDGDYNNITGNTIVDMSRKAINIYEGEGNIVYKNICNAHNSQHCIRINKGINNFVISNIVNTYGNTRGREYSSVEIHGNLNHIENNTITSFFEGEGIGLCIIGSENIITRNTIDSFQYLGIEILWTFGFKNIISYNNIINNKNGIIITGKSNQIECNNFINNSHNAFFYRYSFFNIWDSNYWGGSRILPYLIIGRLYLSIIPWIQFDWNPASEPYDI